METIIPTTASIETAIRNGEAQRAEYDVETWGCNLWFVNRKDTPTVMYGVDTEKRTCNCPQFTHKGICKHLYMAEMEERILSEEARMQAEAKVMEYGEYDLSKW